VRRHLAWRPLLREAGAYLLAGLTVCLLVLLAWWTRHPDSSSLSAVRQWPLIGVAAGRLQDRYLQASRVEAAFAPHDGASSAPVGLTRVGRDRAASPPAESESELLSRGSAEPLVEYELVYALRAPRAYIWVAEGATLRSEPSLDAQPVHRMEALTNLFVEERRGDWVRVRHLGRDAWLLEVRGGSSERHGNRPAPVLPIPGHGPEPAVIDRAVGAMAGGGRAFELGPYQGLTDADIDPLVAGCRLQVGRLEATYVDETGLRPMGRTEERLFLFAEQQGYESFHTGELRSRTGHAGSGYAALLVGRRGALEVCGSLLHEAVHLLNRRAIGPALPPWLDEGLASHVRSRVSGESVPVVEARSARVSGTLPALRALVELDQQGYHGPDESLHYELSALWIGYLLSDGERKPRFRSFLAYLARGGPWSHDPTPATFESARTTPGLGDDLVYFLEGEGRPDREPEPERAYRALDAAFRVWLWSRE
jgi:hypothetical protein